MAFWTAPRTHLGPASNKGRAQIPKSSSLVATLSFEQVEGTWTITTIHLELSGRVPGIDPARFREIANEAKEKCPVSRVLKADLGLTANLSGA